MKRNDLISKEAVLSILRENKEMDICIDKIERLKSAFDFNEFNEKVDHYTRFATNAISKEPFEAISLTRVKRVIGEVYHPEICFEEIERETEDMER